MKQRFVAASLVSGLLSATTSCSDARPVSLVSADAGSSLCATSRATTEAIIVVPSVVTMRRRGLHAKVRPGSGLTCQWSMINGEITSGTHGTEISFTAGEPGTATIACDAADGSGRQEREIEVRPYGLELIAGQPSVSGHRDGLHALFHEPRAADVDADGIIYVPEPMNRDVRKVWPDGCTETIAGAPGVLGAEDGPALQARFSKPVGVALDGEGNLFIIDERNATLRVLTREGVVRTLVGRAEEVGSQDGDGTVARLRIPTGVYFVSPGMLLVGDYGNNVIRRVAYTSDWTARVETVAGDASDPNPRAQDGEGAAIRFWGPHDVTPDGQGGFLVADNGARSVRRLTFNGQLPRVTTLGTRGAFHWPRDVALDPQGRVLVAESGSGVVSLISPDQSVSVLVGARDDKRLVLGNLASARMSGPTSITMDALGDFVLVDAGAHVVLRLRYNTDEP
ncbi:MAG: hypothetical protein AB2A00_06535 [Myxococcota bacterium]